MIFELLAPDSPQNDNKLHGSASEEKRARTSAMAPDVASHQFYDSD